MDSPLDDFVDELKPGTQLLQGQYTIVRFINAGGFGITYLAKNSLDRDVVIKECFPGTFCRRTKLMVCARSRSHESEFAQIVRLFVQEAKSLSRLIHPNIVGVHQVFEDNNTAYMAIDFIDGRDLLEVIENDRASLTPNVIVSMLRKLLGAVAFIHDNGMLHRDISPDNILINRAGEPILIDFGAARQQATTVGSKALSALRVVKDGYSPQEFYIGGSRQSGSSDLYALAASFYHAISGEVPPNSQARLVRLAEASDDLYEPLAGRFEGYPEGFLEAIDTAMNVLPRDRMQSAKGWLEKISKRPDLKVVALDTALTREGGAAPEAKAGAAPAQPAAAAAADTAARAAPAWTGGSRGNGFLLASAAVLAISIALSVSVLVQPDAPAPVAPGQAGAAPEITGRTAGPASVPAVAATVAPRLVPAPSADDTASAGQDAATPPQSAVPTAPAAAAPPAPATTPASAPEPAAVEPPAEVGAAVPDATVTADLAGAPAAGAGAAAVSGIQASLETDESADAVAAQPAGPGGEADLPRTTIAADQAPVTQAAVPVGAIPEVEALPELVPVPSIAETAGASAPRAAEAVAAAEPAATPDAAVTPPPAAAAVSPRQVASAGWDLRLPFRVATDSDGIFPRIAAGSADPDGDPANAWIAEGVVIYAIGGTFVSDEASILRALSAQIDPGPDARVTVPARIKAGAEAPFTDVTLSVPAVHVTELRSGIRLETTRGRAGWTTVVAEVPLAVAGGLRTGDVVLRETTSGEAVDAVGEIETILGRLAEEGQSAAIFAVERAGTVTPARLDLAMDE